jgi:bacillithiol biosynthesis cysteine-adding enzyme BshC
VPLEAGTSSTKLPVDIRQLPWISRLAGDYAWHFERLAPFYRGTPADPNTWRDVIASVQAHARPRSAMAAILRAQQRRRGAPAEAVAAVDSLADRSTVAVVTGQQAGLFGGPLFTLLKALSAIRLAADVRATHHVPAVPVFWVDAEDHDWDEVRHCRVLDADAVPRTVTLADLPGAHTHSIGQVRLDDSVDAALETLFSLLPRTEFTTDVADRLRAAYRPGASMAEAFASWLESLLGPRGLVVFDASDPEAKPLVADLFAREVQLAGETGARAAAAGAALASRGYHAQVTPAAGTLALFSLGPAGRLPMRVHEHGFLVGTQPEARTALAARVRRAPSEFGPNVLLRPLVQDTLFPTICYVAGPSELAYLGQLRDVYIAFGVPMPLVVPRASATLIDANAWRFLARHDLPLAVLKAQDESALNQLLEASLPPAVDAAFADTLRSLQTQMARVTAEVERIDATLAGAARSTLGRMQDDLQKLQGKVVQAAKRKDDVLRRQFRHAQAQAFPGGHPQEREVGLVYFVNKYGPSLIDRLTDTLSTEMGSHWLLTV